MIALSLWQPYASAMFVPRKDDPARMLKGIETRGWLPSAKSLKPGDRFAIHAALTQRDPQTKQRLQQWWIANVKRSPVFADAFTAAGLNDWCDLPFGAVLGFGTFLGSETTTQLLADGAIDSTEKAWGDYSAGRFGWKVGHITRLSTPLPWKGRQGFFHVELGVESRPAPELEVTSSL